MAETQGGVQEEQVNRRDERPTVQSRSCNMGEGSYVGRSSSADCAGVTGLLEVLAVRCANP